MRIKSNIIPASYAEQDILAPGQYIAADSYGFSRNYTTAAEPIVDAAAPVIRSHGNAQGSLRLPVCVDLESEPAALAEAMRRTAFVEDNPVGTLILTVGEPNGEMCVSSWQAGVNSIDVSIAYSGKGVRLTFTYEFVLGKSVVSV